MRVFYGYALLLVGLVAIGAWYFQTADLCPVPLSYRIGAYDERFLLPREAVVPIIEQAAAAWHRATGRQLFIYDESADFFIDFVYDERQERAVAEIANRAALDEKAERTAAARTELETLTVEYETTRADYQKALTSYEARLTRYNTEVASYNAQGGVPQHERARLEQEATTLETLARRLEEQVADLNAQVARLNAAGEAGNALVSEYNRRVAQYNDRYGEVGAFTQGEYTGERIVIYKYTDAIELRQVLAHELGHALGIGHVEAKESIMYYLLAEQPDELSVSAVDVDAFTAVCGQGDEWPHVTRRLIRSVVSLF
jgi:hypothetical protein